MLSRPRANLAVVIGSLRVQAHLHRAVQQKVVARRSFATGRRVGHQRSSQRRPASMRFVVGYREVAVGECWLQRQPPGQRPVQRSW
jgi:hypothetical protein